jgi:hypothetical protein
MVLLFIRVSRNLRLRKAIIRQLQQRISHKELHMDKMPDKPVYKNLKKQNYATNIK